MLTSSRKAKGRNLQNAIKDLMLQKYDMLSEGDVKVAIMGESGTDIKLSPLGERIIPFDIEAKNQESLSIWAALEQAEGNSKKNRIPLVVFKRNRSKIYCCLDFTQFLDVVYKGYSKHMFDYKNKYDVGEINEEE